MYDYTEDHIELMEALAVLRWLNPRVHNNPMDRTSFATRIFLGIDLKLE
jgi:hypothetical protein